MPFLGPAQCWRPWASYHVCPLLVASACVSAGPVPGPVCLCRGVLGPPWERAHIHAGGTGHLWAVLCPRVSSGTPLLDCIVLPPNSYAEALISSVTVCGRRTFKAVMKVE